MATRSGIGALNPDGTVESVYCHWDGGPEWVGRVLATNYTAPAKVRALLAHGNISSIGPEIGERHPFNEPNETVCTFYGRDRGDARQAARHHETPDAFYAWAKGSGAEFVYLYTPGGWRWLKATNTVATTDHELWDELAKTVWETRTEVAR